MQTLHVIERIDDSYGGPAKSVPSLCRALKFWGVGSVIISVNRLDAMNEEIDGSELVWIKCKPLFNRSWYISAALPVRLSRAIRQTDVVHLHSLWSLPSVFAYFFCLLFNKPLFVSPRSSLIKSSLAKSRIKKSIFKLLFANRLLAYASGIIVSSELEQRDLPASLKKKSYIVPNSISPRCFDESLLPYSAGATFGMTECDLTIGFISRIHSRKGFDIFIDILVSAKNEFPDKSINILCAGPIDDQALFDTQMAKLLGNGLEKNFKYLGLISGDDKAKFYKACDIVILPSKFENFGMCIAESLAHGTPVMCSTGTPWQVINVLQGGWCIELDCFRSALFSVMASGHIPSASKARSYVLENFSEKAVGESMKKIYSSYMQR